MGASNTNPSLSNNGSIKIDFDDSNFMAGKPLFVYFTFKIKYYYPPAKL
jgi:hypothetical protein